MKLFSVVSVVTVVVTFIFISPTVTLAFASLSPISSQTPAQEDDDGVIILEGATVIDRTGDLPKPNTTIIINGSRIASLSSSTANS